MLFKALLRAGHWSEEMVIKKMYLASLKFYLRTSGSKFFHDQFLDLNKIYVH